jgi:hypothetical protein
MKNSATLTIEKKAGKIWTAVDIIIDDEFIYKDLAEHFAAKYIGKAPYIGAIQRRNNYDGTQTYTVNYKPDAPGMVRIRRIYKVALY